jgi:hypothetical protein
MHSSLSWIEWLDRLDRNLNAAREDVAVLARAGMLGLAAVERSRRQLAALTHDLRLLDPSVLGGARRRGGEDEASELRRALDTVVFHLGQIGRAGALGMGHAADWRGDRERILAAIDASLRDCFDATAALLGLRRRSA